MIHWKRLANWSILALIISIAIYIRYRINFGSKLMPGVNALYYPIQVRSLIERGHLAYKDFPLLFWIEALIAKLLVLLRLGSLSDCIILSSKLVDSIFPAFSAIPVFLLVSEWQDERPNIRWTALLSSAFSIIYFPALLMTSDFQKNALGIVWVYSFLYFLYRSTRSYQLKYYIFTLVSFILITLTHVGCLGLASLLLISTISSLFVKRIRAKIAFISLAITLSVLTATLSYMYLFVDSVRIKRLLSSIYQLKLFENNIISLLINKHPIPMAPHDIANMILINVLAIIGLLLIIRKKDSLQSAKLTIILSAVISSLIMTSLTIGQEWFGRLLMMAYVPASLILSFLMVELSNATAKSTISAFTVMLLLISIIMGVNTKKTSSITEEAYLELNEIGHVIDKSDKTLIVARHGLEWWTAWILRTHVAQDRSISPETWEHYDTVLFLEQIADLPKFGPFGMAGPPFKEVEIPPDAEIIYEGEYFRLAKVHTPPPFPPPPMF